jgi:hypothetical protein
MLAVVAPVIPAMQEASWSQISPRQECITVSVKIIKAEKAGSVTCGKIPT